MATHDVVFNNFTFQTDSSDYELIEHATKDIVERNIPGMFLEIGTRAGGSLAWILNSLQKYNDLNRKIICVDPWGSIMYQQTEARATDSCGYSNIMRKDLYSCLYQALRTVPFNVLVLPMEDTEYMKRFADYVPFYDKVKEKEDKYAFVFIDGPHAVKEVMDETVFFAERMSIGGYILYDDVTYYPHNLIHSELLYRGFVEAGRGSLQGKILYKYEGIPT